MSHRRLSRLAICEGGSWSGGRYLVAAACDVILRAVIGDDEIAGKLRDGKTDKSPAQLWTKDKPTGAVGRA